MTKCGEAQHRVIHCRYSVLVFQGPGCHGTADSHGGQAAAPMTRCWHSFPHPSLCIRLKLPQGQGEDSTEGVGQCRRGSVLLLTIHTVLRGSLVSGASCFLLESQDTRNPLNVFRSQKQSSIYLLISSQVLNCYWKRWHPDWETKQNREWRFHFLLSYYALRFYCIADEYPWRVSFSRLCVKLPRVMDFIEAKKSQGFLTLSLLSIETFVCSQSFLLLLLYFINICLTVLIKNVAF